MRPSPITPWCWEMGHLGGKNAPEAARGPQYPAVSGHGKPVPPSVVRWGSRERSKLIKSVTCRSTTDLC